MLKLISLIAASMLLLFIAATSQVKAHSWYDDDCCNERDCAPVLAMSYNKLTKRYTVATKHGKTSFSMKDEHIKHRVSQDGSVHVCMIYDDYGWGDQAGTGSSEIPPYVACVYWPAT